MSSHPLDNPLVVYNQSINHYHSALNARGEGTIIYLLGSLGSKTERFFLFPRPRPAKTSLRFSRGMAEPGAPAFKLLLFNTFETADEAKDEKTLKTLSMGGLLLQYNSLEQEHSESSLRGHLPHKFIFCGVTISKQFRLFDKFFINIIDWRAVVCIKIMYRFNISGKLEESGPNVVIEIVVIFFDTGDEEAANGAGRITNILNKKLCINIRFHLSLTLLYNMFASV